MKNNFLFPLCSRCQINQSEYKCENCPILFNTLCSQCDTIVHSIIPEKLMHKKIRIGTSKKSLENLNNENLIINDFPNYESLKNNNNSNGNYLNKRINLMENNNDIYINEINKLFNDNKVLKKENEKLKNQMKNDEKDYDNKIELLNNKLYEYENQINKLQNELNSKNEIVKDINKEKFLNKNLEERKEVYEYKFKDLERQKKYLLNQIEEQKKISDEKNDVNDDSKEKENNILKEKIKILEINKNQLNKKLNDLEKENKDLIRRLSNKLNSQILIPTKDIECYQKTYEINNNNKF